MDYMTLLGTGKVAVAGRAMAEAADTMVSAVGQLDNTLEMHQRRMEEFLVRFEDAVEKLVESSTKLTMVNNVDNVGISVPSLNGLPSLGD